MLYIQYWTQYFLSMYICYTCSNILYLQYAIFSNKNSLQIFSLHSFHEGPLVVAWNNTYGLLLTLTSHLFFYFSVDLPQKCALTFNNFFSKVLRVISAAI